MLDTVERDELAHELGEWMLIGVTPILHDFEDKPLLINSPLPERYQGILFPPPVSSDDLTRLRRYLAQFDPASGLDIGPHVEPSDTTYGRLLAIADAAAFRVGSPVDREAAG